MMILRKIRAASLFAAVLGTAFAAPVGAQVLKGSEASVLRMYQFASRNNFEFYRTGTAIRNAAKAGELAQLKSNADYELHQVTYPYVMSEAKLFVERLASQYRSHCGARLVVTSATRPQTMRLANASDRSVHSTGMALDLRSSKIPTKCQTWLRDVLTHLERSGVIEATEERNPPHFHVAIFPAPYSRYVSNQNIAIASSTSAAAIENGESESGPSGEPELQVVRHTVRVGDSLWRIANRHDTNIKALQDLNKMRSDMIKPGQVILVPTYATPR